MADNSKIEWTDASWNPIRARNLATGRVGWHCEHVTPGCAGCYAEGFNLRLGTKLPYKPGHRRDVEIFLDDVALTQPLRWRRPRQIFVCSMTDLFADFVTDEMIDKVFAVMALCPQHTFQVLTKRAERMREYLSNHAGSFVLRGLSPGVNECVHRELPLPNVWLGVSCERQEEADERIPLLLQTPAAIRFVSAEPLLGPIDLGSIIRRALFGGALLPDGKTHPVGWVIVGGESGPQARPMNPVWARELRDQCVAGGVPFFFKQHGEWREPTGDEDYDTSRGRAGKPPAFIISRDGTVHCFQHLGDDDRPVVIRVGKKAAGRLLDGREWNEMPR